MAISRIDHASLYTPDLGRTLAFYEGVLGMRVLDRSDQHAHLSCHSATSADLTLVSGKTGLRDFTFGVDGSEDLDRVAATLSRENVIYERQSGGERPGEGAALAFVTPSGHTMRLAVGTNGRRAGVTNFDSHGTAGPSGLDHINLIGEAEPQLMREFLARIGFRFSFSFAVAGTIMGTWMRSTPYDHDLAYTRALRPTDRLHHLAFSVEDGNHYFRLSDRLMENGLRWEFGPGRHNIGLGTPGGFGTNNYAYVVDPGGNRIEFCTGMDQMADDAEPRVLDIAPEQVADVMNGWGHEHPDSMMLGS